MPKSWFSINAKAERPSLELYGIVGDFGISPEYLSAELDALGDIKELDVYIHTKGGSVLDGYAVYNILDRHPAKITTYNLGIAASMGSYLFMLGDRRVMANNSWLMVHGPMGGTMDSPEGLHKYADFMAQVREEMIETYFLRGNLSRDEVAAMLAPGEDTWLNAQAAIDNGFATEIEGEADFAIAASLEPTLPDSAPKELKAALSEASPKPSAVADNPEAKHEEITMPEAKKATDQPVDEKEIQARVAADFQAKQKQRVTDINAAFDGFEKHIELRNQCIADVECSVEDARAKLLDALGKDQKPSGSVFVRDEGNQAKVNAMADVVAMRSGFKKSEEVGENPYRGKSLVGLAEACLEARGVSLAGMDRMQIVGAAFTHSSGDFSKLLANTANKAMLMGAEEANETFQLWTRAGQLGDFKVADRVDLNEFPTLDKVQEGAEYKYATMGDRAEQIQLATYGKLFSITRQAIINDDLDAFTRIPNRMGRAALRTVGDLVYAILTSNPNMADGNPLFHASHNNLLTAAGISTSSVDAMQVAMGTQKGAGGIANLNIELAYLLVPRALRGIANQVRTSQYEVGASAKNNTTPNYVANTFEVVSDSRLDAASATNWYGAANPMTHDTIEVAYLDGNSMPVLEEQDGWKVDGVEFKVRMDAGVSPLDFRTMAKNPAS